jgi:hypothetical protein
VCLAGEVSGNVTNVGEAASPTLEFSRLTYLTGVKLEGGGQNFIVKS